MGNKRPKKYVHNMVLRLDEDTNTLIEGYSKMVGINKTQLIRNSISNFTFLNLDIPDYPNPKSIISQSLLHFLFDKCQNDEDLQELAQISFDLSHIELGNSDTLRTVLEKKDPQDIAKMMIDYGLSPKGHGWFDESKYVMKGKNVYIFGTHNLGPNFHIFMNKLLSLYFEMIDYELKEDKQDIEEIKEKSKEYDMRYVKRRFYKYSVVFAPLKK